MRVIGTAGHVDHGKSALIAALTGTHPDRLIEEQQREMTIELGFAWLTLPRGEEIGIIDVPGHRDFIGNMLAGVGGIDAVMLVISADEGVMPQTKEHLSILNLLQVNRGVIVLSKSDLVEDPEWFEMIEMDIRNLLINTCLKDAPIIRTSATKKQGLDLLLDTLEEILQNYPERKDHGRPRLPIDRVFSIAGFGTVVTGTLLDGTFYSGDEIEILPTNKFGRIRGLQNHKKKELQAVPGSRTAINISGLTTEEIQRGDTVALRGQYKTSRSVVVNVNLLPDISTPIKHGTEIKIYLGTSEIMSKIRLLGTNKLDSGENGWLQLELNEPAVTMRGDRFIVRRPSPGETIGGGVIVESNPIKRYKRFDQETIQSLETMLEGTPKDILLQAVITYGPGVLKDIVEKTGLDNKNIQSPYDELKNSGLIITFDEDNPENILEGIVMSMDQYQRIKNQIESIIGQFHQQHPLKQGLSREELKNRLKLTTQIYNPLLHQLEKEKIITDKGSLIFKPGFVIQYSEDMNSKREELIKLISKEPLSPPSVKECINLVGDEMFSAMIKLGELIQVSPDVVFHEKDYSFLVEATKAHIEEKGQITVAEARDLFMTSRKYILALFEYMDSKGITIRENDFRRLRR